MTFKLSVAEETLNYCNCLSVLFTNDSLKIDSTKRSIIDDRALPIMKHVFKEKEKWKTFSLTYTAGGGEKYLTLGNFLPEKSYSVKTPFHMTLSYFALKSLGMTMIYVFIDDVSLVEEKD